ncbi:hypothetical protein ACLK1T_17635 [Escherichia coli]
MPIDMAFCCCGLWLYLWIMANCVDYRRGGVRYKLTVASGTSILSAARLSPSPTISVCRCY